MNKSKLYSFEYDFEVKPQPDFSNSDSTIIYTFMNKSELKYTPIFLNLIF